MPETDNILDQLFEKARNADPLFSLNEIKTSLNTPRPKSSLFSNHWIYISLSCVIGMVILLSTYKQEEPEQEKSKHFIPMQENRNLLEKQETHLKEEKKELAVKKVKRMAANHSNIPKIIVPDTLTIVQDSSSVMVSLMKPDSLTIDSTYKTPEHFIPTPETKISGLVIYKFSNVESIRLYQSRLADAGIRLEITEIEYDKKYPDNIIQLAADLFVQDSFYKSINITDFKELRIQWETESSGITKIKSVSILDKFYMLKML